ncbi:50S ribosomal protein L18e [Candidatus Woesearchaeota archaeon]|nr:50S ribosomal protein L18e [Candidatus Woesearchaeota archaeon]
MPKPTGPSSIPSQQLILSLKKLAVKEESPLWKRVADELSNSSRKRREVNLDRLQKYTQANETVVVPGKVLGQGHFDKKITVAAFKFSEPAKNVINKTGRAITLTELMQKNPTGKGVKILG